jgi:hypothetical protein
MQYFNETLLAKRPTKEMIDGLNFSTSGPAGATAR